LRCDNNGNNLGIEVSGLLQHVQLMSDVEQNRWRSRSSFWVPVSVISLGKER